MQIVLYKNQNKAYLLSRATTVNVTINGVVYNEEQAIDCGDFTIQFTTRGATYSGPVFSLEWKEEAVQHHPVYIPLNIEKIVSSVSDPDTKEVKEVTFLPY